MLVSDDNFYNFSSVVARKTIFIINGFPWRAIYYYERTPDVYESMCCFIFSACQTPEEIIIVNIYKDRIIII